MKKNLVQSLMFKKSFPRQRQYKIFHARNLLIRLESARSLRTVANPGDTRWVRGRRIGDQDRECEVAVVATG